LVSEVTDPVGGLRRAAVDQSTVRVVSVDKKMKRRAELVVLG